MNDKLKYYFVQNGRITNQYRLIGDMLYFVSASGERKDDARCMKTSAHYKLYAIHHDCALSYTVYLLADRESGIVYRLETNFPVLSEIRNCMD